LLVMAGKGFHCAVEWLSRRIIDFVLF